MMDLRVWNVQEARRQAIDMHSAIARKGPWIDRLRHALIKKTHCTFTVDRGFVFKSGLGDLWLKK